MKIWADIYQSTAKLGSGPVQPILRARMRDRLDRIGEFEVEVPANASNVDLLRVSRSVWLYGLVGGAVTYLGGGPIDQIVTRVRDDGTATFLVKGGDLLRELTYRTTGALTLSNSNGFTNEGTLLNLVTAQGWTYDQIAGIAAPSQARFVYEPLFGAILNLEEKIGGHVRRGENAGDPRHIETFRESWELEADPSFVKILATMHGDPYAVAANPHACLITDIEVVSESYDMCTRAYLWGAGDGEARFTIAAATLWPDALTAISSPYSVDGQTYASSLANHYIENSTAEGTYGRRDVVLAFKDIAPLTNGSLSLAWAANYLVQAGQAYLHQRRQPYKSYRLRVAGLTHPVRPGDAIYVQARKFVDGEAPIDIAEELYVLEVERVVDQLGVYTVGLSVANALRWGEGSGEYTAKQLNASQVMQAHPQTGPVAYWFPFRVYVGEDQTDERGEVPLILGNEVTWVDQVLLRVKVGALVAFSSTTGGTVISSGPSSEETTGLAGAAVNHGHALEVTQYSGAHAGYALYWDATAGLNIDNGLSGLATGGSTTLVEPDHEHNIEHDHEIDLSTALTTTYGIYKDPGTPLAASEIEFSLNLASWTTVSTGTLKGGYYEHDITSLVASGTPPRPTSTDGDYTIYFRRTSAGPTGRQAMVDVLVGPRYIQQSVSYS